MSRGETMDSDIEEFLYKMLGNGFQLEKSVIQDVVSQCGYNMPMLQLWKRVMTLLVSLLEVSNTDANSDELISPQTETKEKNIQREVLEKESSGPIRPVRRSPYGRVVHKPLNRRLSFYYKTTMMKMMSDVNQNWQLASKTSIFSLLWRWLRGLWWPNDGKFSASSCLVGCPLSIHPSPCTIHLLEVLWLVALLQMTISKLKMTRGLWLASFWIIPNFVHDLFILTTDASLDL